MARNEKKSRFRPMASFAREAKASYAFVERNFHLVKRYMGWEIVFLAYTIVNTLTIGLIAVGVGDPQQVLYLVIGALLWGYLSVLFEVVSEDVAWERWEGTIEYTFMAPISRLARLGGTCSFAALYGILRTAIVLGIVRPAAGSGRHRRVSGGAGGLELRLHGARDHRRRAAADFAGTRRPGHPHRPGSDPAGLRGVLGD